MSAPQPSDFTFDAASEAEIAQILARYPAGKQASGVIPLLYVAQRQMGRATGSAWVPKVAMDVIAERLSMPPIRVYEVATFYFMFNMKPIGRHHLQLCGTTPCMLRGSDDVLRACHDAAGVKVGQTSADGLFTLTEVECLGACVNAPVVAIDDYYHEDLSCDELEKLIDALERGEKIAPGSARGRQTSAPESGALTLNDPALYDGSLAKPLNLPNLPEKAT